MNYEDNESRKEKVPVWEKVTITIDEAVAYSGVGRDKLREITEQEDCEFVVWIGRKRLIKREKFKEYLENAYSI